VKQNKQRNQHINELLETERTYVYRIKQVVKVSNQSRAPNEPLDNLSRC